MIWTQKESLSGQKLLLIVCVGSSTHSLLTEKRSKLDHRIRQVIKHFRLGGSVEAISIVFLIIDTNQCSINQKTSGDKPCCAELSSSHAGSPLQPPVLFSASSWITPVSQVFSGCPAPLGYGSIGVPHLITACVTTISVGH